MKSRLLDDRPGHRQPNIPGAPPSDFESAGRKPGSQPPLSYTAAENKRRFLREASLVLLQRSKLDTTRTLLELVVMEAEALHDLIENALKEK